MRSRLSGKRQHFQNRSESVVEAPKGLICLDHLPDHRRGGWVWKMIQPVETCLCLGGWVNVCVFPIAVPLCLFMSSLWVCVCVCA